MHLSAEGLFKVLFFFCLFKISSKFCFDEFKTTSFDLKLFFIELIELGKIEKKDIKKKLSSNVLKKFKSLLFNFINFFFVIIILIDLYN